jgi:hypothetical protein
MGIVWTFVSGLSLRRHTMRIDVPPSITRG